MKKKLMLFIFFIMNVYKVYCWGPHDKITKAALEVIPDKDKWIKILGEKNFNSLINYSWLPDQVCQDLGEFFADDYLLLKTLPFYIEHRDDLGQKHSLREGYKPHFYRAFQALRTETPIEACRHLGPLIHYIEDSGAPPHAKPIYTQEHSSMENWIKIEEINIKGYIPKLLGKNVDEAYENLLKRLEYLLNFAKEKAEIIFPLVKSNEREKVEPIVLECALESAKVVADTIYTLFVLGLTHEEYGGIIKGEIMYPKIPQHEKKGARIILLDNEKFLKLKDKLPLNVVLFHSSTDYTTFTDPDGHFEFKNLPQNIYRIVAYKIGTKLAISDPIKVENRKITNININLPPSEPPMNLIYNPDFKLFYIWENIPDRWFKKIGWQYPSSFLTSSIVTLPKQTSFKCGAILKDTKTKIKFEFRETLWGKPIETIILTGNNNREEIFLSKDKVLFCIVIVETEENVWDKVEKVYLIPEVKKE